MTPEILRAFLPALRPSAFCVARTDATAAGFLTSPAPWSDLHPLLAAIRWQADLLFYDARGISPIVQQSNSPTVQDFLLSLPGLLSPRGELLAIVPRRDLGPFGDLTRPRYARSTASPAHLEWSLHVWLTLEDSSPTVQQSNSPSDDPVALYYARSHIADTPRRLDLAQYDTAAAVAMARRRPVWRDGAAVCDPHDANKYAEPGWHAALDEWRRRRGRGPTPEHEHNVRLEHGRLRIWLDPWQRRLPDLPLAAAH